MDYAVILAGGSGTRLWPMSRKNKPKQFQSLIGEKTLIQGTYGRIKSILPEKQIFICASEENLKQAKFQLKTKNRNSFIIEPSAKNTAPAIGLLTNVLYQKDKDATIGSFASDHMVTDKKNFAKVVKIAYKASKKYPDHLIVIGLKPTRPDTGFGYIKMGSPIEKINGQEIFKVERFVEKPDLATAKKYVTSGRYLWNASYFIFNALIMLGWFEKYLPETYKQLQKVQKNIKKNPKNRQVILREFSKIKNEPIDTAIVEKINKILVIPADFGWSDIGNWSILYDILSQNNKKNIISEGKHLDFGSDSIMVKTGDKLIATVGLKDVVVVDTPDATLILNKSRAQDVKKIIEIIEERNEQKYL